MRNVSISKINYKGWPNCWRLSNGRVELVVTSDVGPRIIRFGFVGQRNELREVPETLGKCGGSKWNSFGGHRFWHAPEHARLSYLPDNEAVEVQVRKGYLRLIQKTEKGSCLRKELDVFLSHSGRVRLVHRLRNMTRKPILRSPWVLTVMAAGGKAIVPLPRYYPHPQKLLPEQHMAIWSFTEMADKRWVWGNSYIQLKQSTKINRSQKLGLAGAGNWAAYLNRSHLFIKKFKVFKGLPYPDRGCSTEIFTDQHMLELESLAPLLPIAPGKAATHSEDWHLFEGLKPMPNDAAITRHLLPRLKKCR